MKKLKVEDPWQVRTDMFSVEKWLEFKKSKKDLCCTECKVLYKDIKDDKLAMMTIHGKPNRHLCNTCGRRYIEELGAVDITKNIKEKALIKSLVVSDIKDYLLKLGERGYTDSYFEEKDIKALEKILDDLQRRLSEKERLDAIVIDDTPLEDYLIKEYGVIKDAKWLKDTSQIEDYFKDHGYDLLDCGQGYSQDEAEQIICIGNLFYLVKVEAEIESSKQDRGDRLYWVERIESVTYELIDKPLPKERVEYKIDLVLTVDQAASLDKYLKDLGYITK